MVKKAKGKQWFTIIAPELFEKKELGRTMVSDPKSLIGRKITISLMNLTEDFSKYYLKLRFKIVSVEDNKALTAFDGSECLHDYISRMVLRRSRRVDAVQDLTTKDGVKIRVKALAIIPRRIKSSIQATIRDRMRDMVRAEVESLSLDEFIRKMTSDEIKNRILQEARRIYPVRKFEIRKTEIL